MRIHRVKLLNFRGMREVEIELSTGPYRFSLRKRWHRQRETVLQVFAPNKFQLTGRETHDKAREILGA